MPRPAVPSHPPTAWQLLKAVKRRPGSTETQVDGDAVLLRAYGKGTEVLIDRERTVALSPAAVRC